MTSESGGSTSAEAHVTIDTDSVRVTTWTFAGAGDRTGTHTHTYNYIVVPITGGSFTVANADGSDRLLDQRPGEPYAGVLGVTHDVINNGERAVFVEVEIKT